MSRDHHDAEYRAGGPQHRTDRGRAHHHHAVDHFHPSGVRGALAEIFRPHSHDAANRVDTALGASERGLTAVKISFAALDGDGIGAGGGDLGYRVVHA